VSPIEFPDGEFINRTIFCHFKDCYKRLSVMDRLRLVPHSRSASYTSIGILS